jgi:monoamine oxidase
MGRSLFAQLHRRFGRRITGEERTRRAALHTARLREALADDLSGSTRFAAQRTNPRLGVIGAGFAGLSAAWFAHRAGVAVTVIEPGRVGGRVWSRHDFVEGRILEAGAELIGTNHPMWLKFADTFGFALSLITSEDQFDAVGLEMPLLLNGRHLNRDEQKKVYGEMDDVFRAWADQSKVVADPWRPWTTPGATRLDSESLEQHIPSALGDLTKAAIRTEFELDNTIPVTEQSWLGNLAQIAAGGGYAFFEDTEVFRCAAGNQELARRIAAGLNVDAGRALAIHRNGDQIYVELANAEHEGPFDYLIVAIPSVHMETLTIDRKPFPYRAIGHGPAVKYLSGLEQRFWITEGLAPSAMSDKLGMTWEGTDNQMDTARFDLSVFAGGAAAKAAIDGGGGPAHYEPLLRAVFPKYKAFKTEFQNWPKRAGMGYSCPRPGEVTTKQKEYAELIGGNIAVAGEHTSAAWFGFMEGALQSGLMAAARVAKQAGVPLPPVFGKFSV